MRLALFAVLLICSPLMAQNAHYRKDGPALLNDLRYTPGSVRTTDPKELCPHAHTKAVRHVTRATKEAACKEYGIAPAKCTGANYEQDHLISLELGGSNDLANIWPEPYLPWPGAREKDRLENALHRDVCTGKLSLKSAQEQIRTDWWKAYRKYVGEARRRPGR